MGNNEKDLIMVGKDLILDSLDIRDTRRYRTHSKTGENR